jgi:hypothetical protein
MGDLDARIEALEVELRRLREERHAPLKAAYLASDARLDDLPSKFGVSRSQIGRLAKQFGWPKRKQFQTPEQRAKRSATFKAKGLKPSKQYVPERIRPAKGTAEYRLFKKLADRCGLGAAAAHAELRRGVSSEIL